MKSTEEIDKEFDEKFPILLTDKQEIEIKSFLHRKIDEERERVRGWAEEGL